MAASLVTLLPSAASAEPCPVPPPGGAVALACPEAGVAFADAVYAGNGNLLVKGWTNGWSVGTIKVEAILYYNGSPVWGSGVKSCPSSISCTLPTSTLDCRCWTGHVMLRVWGWRGSGAKVMDEDWEYVPPAG